jgi:molybdopterin synthase sulfur carrier subunit
MAAEQATPEGNAAATAGGAAAGGRPSGTIRYWAAAKAAAGTAEEPYEAATLAEALEAARQRHTADSEFARVLTRCSYIVDGDPVGSRSHETVRLVEGGTVEVLPPFAGG